MSEQSTFTAGILKNLKASKTKVLSTISTLAFLILLWGKNPPAGFFKLFEGRSKKSSNFNIETQEEEIVKKVAELDVKGNDVFFMVCLHPQDTGAKTRGKANEICAIPGVWMDVDIGRVGHKKKKLPRDLDQALDLLRKVGIKPTLIVHSGGGLHVYWLFSEPWILQTPEENKKAKALSKGFQRTVLAIAKTHGFDLDNTADLVRVLRVPGTNNWKESTPREVRVVELNDQDRYAVADIEKFIAENAVSKPVARVKKTRQKNGSRPNASQNEADLEKIRAGCSWVNHCHEDADSLPEPEWFGFITIGCRCRDGERLVHEWSSADPRYSVEETDGKIRYVMDNNYLPVTCDTIMNDLGGDEFCESCENKGKVKSPIVLGMSTKSISIIDGAFDENLCIPKPYVVSKSGGILKMMGGDPPQAQEVISVPVFLTKRLINPVTNEERTEIAWFRDNAWKYKVFERKSLFFTRNIDALAKYGIPVNSVNANNVIHYLNDFEAMNVNNMPVSFFTTHMGWQDDQKFLLGDFVIAKHESEHDDLQLISDSEGAEQFTRGFTVKGEYDAWIDTVNKLYAYTPVMAMVFSSFVSPLLEILEINGFSVDLAYTTSKGKTIALRVAASVWGNPDESSPDAIVCSWNATPVWIERTASLLRGLPMFLDDTKLAGSGSYKDGAKEKVTTTLYQISNGKGRGRGSIDGTQSTGAWRLVLLSTGEEAAIDFTTGKGGAQARVLEIWAPPFGKSGNLFQFVDEINRSVKNNYGYAGRKFVQFLLDHDADWNLWRKSYQDLQNYFGDIAGENTAVKRLSSLFAVLYFTAVLVHAALPELIPTRPVNEVFTELWDLVSPEDDRADVAVDALRIVYEWSVVNQNKFFDKTVNNFEPHQGWAGKWDKDRKVIMFVSRTLKSVLEEAGFEVKSLVKIWAERNWLELASNNRNQKTTDINGKKVSCYHIKEGTFQKALGLESPQGEANLQIVSTG